MKPLELGELHEGTARDIFFRATSSLSHMLTSGAEKADIIATADTVIRADDFFKREAAQDAALEDERIGALQAVRGPFEDQTGLDWRTDMELNILGT